MCPGGTSDSAHIWQVVRGLRRTIHMPIRLCGRLPQMTSLLRRLHFLGGLAIAPFLFVVCCTGIINAFTPQIVDAVHGDQLYTAPHDGPRQPLSEQVTAARSAHPDGDLKSVLVPERSDGSTRVVLSAPNLPDIDSFSDEDLTVYVDPYTNRVLDDDVTVKDRTSAQVWLRHLHGNLHLGEPGRVYSELATSLVPVLVVAGLVLAVGRRRRNRSTARTGSSSRAWGLRTVHANLGVLLSVVLVALAVTGMPQSSRVGDRIDQAVSSFGATAREPKIGEVSPRSGARTIGIDRALTAARSAGLHGDVTITMPSAPGGTIQAAEKPRGWPIESDVVTLDPYSGALLEHIRWADQPLATKAITIGNYLHDGTLFGVLNQVVVVIAATGATVLLVLGYCMWWRRRPYGRSRDADYRHLGAGTLLCFVAVVLITAWAVPLLGASLALFLVVDLLIRHRGRRRAPAQERTHSIDQS